VAGICEVDGAVGRDAQVVGALETVFEQRDERLVGRHELAGRVSPRLDVTGGASHESGCAHVEPAVLGTESTVGGERRTVGSRRRVRRSAPRLHARCPRGTMPPRPRRETSRGRRAPHGSLTRTEPSVARPLPSRPSLPPVLSASDILRHLGEEMASGVVEVEG